MAREVLFEKYINECEKEPLSFCGQGNPNADILIIGQESTDTSEDALIQNIKRCRNKKERDAPRPIDSKNKTWANYQYILDEIYCRNSEYIDKWDFEKFAFTTELSSTPRKQSNYKEARPFINERLVLFKNSMFIQDFPVIILACGGYIKNDDKVREIDNTFHVEFCREHGSKESKNRFWTHIDKKDFRKLVIHTRQFSNGISKDLIKEMASVIRDHLEHLRKLGLIG